MYIQRLMICFISVVMLSANICAQPKQKLVFALDLIRHGDRTPTRTIPAAPHHWAEGLGQLTPQGMQQIFQLGEQFRKKYVMEHHLLPYQYHADTIMVSSTDVKRTLMSAQVFLLGLYPLGTGPYIPDPKRAALPAAYQPVPIHHIKNKMVHPTSNIKLKKLFEKYVYSQKEWREKNASLEKYYPRWSKATGIKITDLHQLIGLGDTLEIYRIHHIDLPDGLSDEDATTIIDAGHWALAAKYKPKIIGDYTGHQLLAHIGAYIDQASQQTFPLTYVFMSAHDATILSILSALQAPLQTKPSYASDVNFALYENGPNKYQVEISYNGAPVDIPGCGGHSCSLMQFMDIIAKSDQRLAF